MESIDMAENIVELLTDVADAIREKNGSTEPIKAQSFPDEIRNLPSGGANGDIVITSASDTIADSNTERWDMSIGGKVTKIGVGAFGGDKRLQRLIFGEGVTEIGINAFLNCGNLASLTLSKSLTKIDSNAFRGTAITSLEIFSATTIIGTYAFNDCSQLTKVVIRATNPPRLFGATFDNNASDRLIYVPDASVDTYKSATNWSAYADSIRPLSELPNE